MDIVKDSTTDLILSDTDGKILYAEEPTVAPVTMYFFGINEDAERPEKVDFDELTQVFDNTNASTVQVEYPETAGWLIYAESIQSPLRTKWSISAFNQGEIGGNWDDFDPNLFPDPITQSYNNKLWRVYISSYKTKLADPISFMS